MAILAQHQMIGELYRDIHIRVYKDGRYDDTINVGMWLLVGEDRQLRFYTDDKYSNPPMYRPISDELERFRAFAKCVLSLADVGDRYEVKGGDMVLNLHSYAVKHGITAESLKVPE